MRNLDNDAINVNPIKWGSLFWSLLHTIAQYSDEIPESRNRDLIKFVSTIPYVLPCGDCANHCHEIYRKRYLLNSASLRTFKRWVWVLKFEVNKYTNSDNIAYEDYLSKLRTTKEFITKNELINLLSMISLSYPSDTSRLNYSRQDNIYLFIKYLSSLLYYVPHLKSFHKFEPTNTWEDKEEFQRWLRKETRRVYSYDIDFDKY